MSDLEPINQKKLLGLEKFFMELIQLYEDNNLPNKILLSGQKGLGKSTLAYHLVNYVLSKDEEFTYDIKKFEINEKNHSFKTTLNKSNPNLDIIDISLEKKFIDISQIRELILNLNKSSFNKKPRFVLIDNVEFLNLNSVNALLKVLEEPTSNVHFILINSNKKILPTLSSRCINFKITLTNKESLDVANKLLNERLDETINKDLINYYLTPGNIYNLFKFGELNEYDLSSLNLKDFLKTIIRNGHYKKNDSIKYLIYDFVEFYFTKLDLSVSTNFHDKYTYFLKKISDTKRFNLDEESLFMEFEDKILNG
ncbi:AAA family ATPase [Pelagibacterales bacterium SAG-MED01]|nr:AAA family ATPase [Pelagibacterales bacterium SAG-MED01]